ncbi:MAG TPA: hypothetical protein VEF34_05105 [Syntrophobacteraceae bacterium]|nr:hypothetical protein [Syntrophobacteraceae bacterium]
MKRLAHWLADAPDCAPRGTARLRPGIDWALSTRRHRFCLVGRVYA